MAYKLGDTIYGKKANVKAFAGQKDGRQYNPFADPNVSTTTIGYVPIIAIFGGGRTRDYKTPADAEIKFMYEESEPSDAPMNLFIGGAVNPGERGLLLEFNDAFGNIVGTYAGKTKFKSGVQYVLVTVQLRGYWGTGNDFGYKGYAWMREADVTNDIDVLTAYVENGKGGDVDDKELKDRIANKKAAGGADQNTKPSTTPGATTPKNNTVLYIGGGLLAALLVWLIAKKS